MLCPISRLVLLHTVYHYKLLVNINKMATGCQVGSVSATHRKVLLHSVSMLCKEEGFHSASKIALETLTELLQSCKLPFASFDVLRFLRLSKVLVHRFLVCEIKWL